MLRLINQICQYYDYDYQKIKVLRDVESFYSIKKYILNEKETKILEKLSKI
jgi:hypothetical protein